MRDWLTPLLSCVVLSCGSPTGEAADGGPGTGSNGGTTAAFIDAGPSVCGQPLTPCASGAACPPDSSCGGSEAGCVCNAGYLAADCEGDPCPRDGGCASKDLQCLEAVAGSCSLENFTVSCNSGDLCPTHASCRTGDVCECGLGYAAVDCGGTACDELDGGCEFPNWWCAERHDTSCGVLNDEVQCPARDGGIFYCPTHSLCEEASCKCNPNGYSAVDCQGKPCSDGECSGNDWWCVP